MFFSALLKLFVYLFCQFLHGIWLPDNRAVLLDEMIKNTLQFWHFLITIGCVSKITLTLTSYSADSVENKADSPAYYCFTALHWTSTYSVQQLISSSGGIEQLVRKSQLIDFCTFVRRQGDLHGLLKTRC